MQVSYINSSLPINKLIVRLDTCTMVCTVSRLHCVLTWFCRLQSTQLKQPPVPSIQPIALYPMWLHHCCPSPRLNSHIYGICTVLTAYDIWLCTTILHQLFNQDIWNQFTWATFPSHLRLSFESSYRSLSYVLSMQKASLDIGKDASFVLARYI